MGVKDRIGTLRKRWQAVEKLFRTGGAKEYEREAREIYGLMREAWEQAVSEVLLNDVVGRYRHSVETQKVRHLHDITQDDRIPVPAGAVQVSAILVPQTAIEPNRGIERRLLTNQKMR